MNKTDLNWNLSLENYRSEMALNQSLLKNVPFSLNVEKDDSDPSVPLVLGKFMEDCIYYGREETMKNFFINKTKIPKDPIKKIIEVCTVRGVDFTNDQSISDIGVEHEYQAKYGVDARAKAIRKYGQDYYDLLQIINKGEKPIISMEDAMIGEIMAKSILENDWTKQFVTDTDDWVTYNNVPIKVYSDEHGDYLKILIDICQVNFALKRVRLIDIKSTGDYLTAFPKSVLKFRYDVQGSFYRHVFSKFMETHSILKDFTLDENFYFVVASVKEPSKSLAYHLDFNDLLGAKLGGKLNIENRFVYRGWEEMINNYHWHTSTEMYTYTKEQYDYILQNNSIPLNLYE